MKVYNHVRTKAMMDKVLETQTKQDTIVLTALQKLGGNIHMRVMEFRKHLDEPMRETQIKEALKRLTAKGVIEMIGERHDSRGHAYRIV